MTDSQSEPKNDAPPGYERIEPDYYLELLQRMHRKSKYSVLPPIDVAMYEEDLTLNTDVSDRRFYNDIFIEPNIMPGLRAWVLQIALIGHNMIFILLAYSIYDGLLREIVSSVVLPVGYFILLAMVLFLLLLKSTRIRFNRQTQMIYMSDGEVSIAWPWREVQGMLESEYAVTGRNDILLVLPYQVEGLLGDVIHYDPYNFSAAFDSGDLALTHSSIQCYEFIRRYMEEGLEAIQPTVENPKVASGYAFSDGSGLPPILHWLLAVPSNIFTLKPLVEWWFNRRAANFTWPAEVDDLCQPDADLSGFDTSTVRSYNNLYYRVTYEFGGYVSDYVDRHGNPVPVPDNILALHKDPFKQD